MQAIEELENASAFYQRKYNLCIEYKIFCNASTILKPGAALR
jgi:hypothetical protein